MKFPIITDQEILILPQFDTLDKISEAEIAFEAWINGKFFSSPTSRQKYVYQNCMNPWFRELSNREHVDKNTLIKEYGTYLRNTIINSAKSKFSEREYLKNYNNLFVKIGFYFKTFIAVWRETGTEQIAIRFGKLMGPEYEKKVRKALSSDAKFDNNGNLCN